MFGSLFTQAVASDVPAGTRQPTAAQLAHLPAAARNLYLHAVAMGVDHIFTVGAVVAVTALAAACLIHEVPLRGSTATPAQPATIPAQPVTSPAQPVTTSVGG